MTDMGAIKSKSTTAQSWAKALSVTHEPDTAWSILHVTEVVKPYDLPDTSAPPAPGHLRVVCISDTHVRAGLDQLPIPQGHILIHAGDFSSTGRDTEIEQFAAFLDTQPHPHKVVIAGNHDLPFDVENYAEIAPRFGHRTPFDGVALKARLARSCTYLEDSAVTIEGVKIYGSPWQPWFHHWAFNLDRGPPIDQKWALIPSDTDILITHGPPVGHGDECTHGGRAGCVDLLSHVTRRIHCKYHVFGHIHEGYGATTNGETVFVNASTCTLQYKPVNPPIVFDIPTRGGGDAVSTLI